MAATYDEYSTLTRKGQTTIPKSVRKALDLSSGDKLRFDIKEGVVTLTRAEPAGHGDPSIGAFLSLLERDIAAGNLRGDLPQAILDAMKEAAELDVDLDEPIEGDVDI
ncbi:MAG: type II toxin-antitoxin system PrlF family antitoxin [Rhodospirillales bacterium]|nr:type II toxin-antitoxin system PrlF family antitoxin [Rhodospirillales bacterium]MDH3911499.1 type II toxin-antitoxin system PrlF family antitoxin [Rhodospirillales bacterium]MDH3918187.1 type II toxin-antitoxin system PrlF family antitoxin [Rhodospirillales bacterium]MDH3968829.1 type II toxin-antitoxin system PrlF family antitoxin [Rhodospirillales bacterium]